MMNQLKIVISPALRKKLVYMKQAFFTLYHNAWCAMMMMYPALCVEKRLTDIQRRSSCCCHCPRCCPGDNVREGVILSGGVDQVLHNINTHRQACRKSRIGLHSTHFCRKKMSGHLSTTFLKSTNMKIERHTELTYCTCRVQPNA